MHRVLICVDLRPAGAFVECVVHVPPQRPVCDHAATPASAKIWGMESHGTPSHVVCDASDKAETLKRSTSFCPPSS